MKAEWLDKVGHIHAQDAAWFLGFILVVGAIALWTDYKKEIKEERKRDGLPK